MKNCPCQSGWSYEECCGAHLGGEPAPTAEDLMRARYTAYVEGRVDFIVETTWPEKQESLDRDHILEWSRSSQWHGLEIHDTVDGGEGDDEGIVRFKAFYTDAQGEDVEHHERSFFRRHEGRWYFVDGEPAHQEPIRREAPKLGRNDPCPCGSGKKLKKCCGAAG
jgi:SEC-C motif-containing protein